MHEDTRGIAPLPCAAICAGILYVLCSLNVKLSEVNFPSPSPIRAMVIKEALNNFSLVCLQGSSEPSKSTDKSGIQGHSRAYKPNESWL